MEEIEKFSKKVEISNLIIERRKEIGINLLKKRYLNSGKINFLQIDELLPEELINKFYLLPVIQFI